MFAQLKPVTSMSTEALDDYLERGWFRMRQTIFTTHFLTFSYQFYSAIWLRCRLSENLEDATFRQLQKKNSQFSVEIQPANITRKQELLYKHYKQSITFQTSDNLRQLLLGYSTHNVFNTYEINIYDSTELIACGYFDLGNTSAAGIVSFYNPNYKKFSLGKYIIYCKMQYCKQLGMQYFYPGYVAPGYSFFEYKLSIAKHTIEYLDLASKTWLPYQHGFALVAIDTMRLKLAELHRFLSNQKVENTIWYYRYFDGSLDPYFIETPLLDYPIFIYFYHASNNGVFHIIVYNVQNDRYELIECTSIYQMEGYENNTAIFSSELLQFDKVLFYSSQPTDILKAMESL